MTREHVVELEWVGSRQTLQIPAEFELAGDRAMIRKEGDRLIIEPIANASLLALLATLEPLEEVFPDVDSDLPPLDDVVL